MGKKRKRSNSNCSSGSSTKKPSSGAAEQVVQRCLSDTFDGCIDNMDDNSSNTTVSCASTATTLSDVDDSDNSSEFLDEAGRQDLVAHILTLLNQDSGPSEHVVGLQISEPQITSSTRRSTSHGGQDCHNSNCARCLGSTYSMYAPSPTFQILHPMDTFTAGGPTKHTRRQTAARHSVRKPTVEQRIQMSGMDDRTKELLLSEDSMCVKNPQWIEGLLSIPFGKFASLKTNKRNQHKPLEKLMHSMNDKVFGMTRVKEELLNFASQMCSNPDSKPRVLGLCSRAGVGKCLAKGTRVWLASGKLAAVETVQIGDKLVGDDQQSREVLELSQGTTDMFRVTNKNGFTYTVTSNHVLTLQLTKEVNIEYDDLDVSYFWLSGTKFIKSQISRADLESAYSDFVSNIGGVRFHEEGKLHRRAFAYWKINIVKKRNSISAFKSRTVDIELQNYLSLEQGFQNLFSNLTLSHLDQFGKLGDAPRQAQKTNNDFWFGVGHQYSQLHSDQIRREIVYYGALLSRLLHQSYHSRYEFCMGFVFGAGAKFDGKQSGSSKTMYNWIKDSDDPSFELFEAICLSTGLTCQIIQSDQQEWCVKIDVNTSPLARHQPIKVERVGVGKYFGFELSGNGRFLLSDLTVTHNTSIVQSLEYGLDRSLQSINLNGMKDSSHLLGFDYTYSQAKHGAILDAIIRAQIMNPILFFDELDKVSGSDEGNEVVSVLMNLTDPISNQAFADKYFHQVFFDLSRCIMIFAFNDEAAIHPVLKDRMHIIYIPVPTPSEKIQISHKFLLPQLCTNIGIKSNSVIFTDEIISFILQTYTPNYKDEGVRPLKKCLESILLRLNTLQILAKSSVKLSYDLKTKFPISLTQNHVKQLLAGNTEPVSHTHMSMYS